MTRDKTIKVGTLFPQTQQGCCAVCKQEITEPRRRRYCSDHCKDVAYAAQLFFKWQKVRDRVMDERDLVCQRCGYDREEYDRHAEEVREQLREEDRSTAWNIVASEVSHQYGVERRKMHLDHIKPVSKGGAMFDPDNLQVLCKRCNLKKSDKYNGRKKIYDFMDRAPEEAGSDGR